MKLENQVVSLELAQKLKELGVKQESMFSHIDWYDNEIWQLKNSIQRGKTVPADMTEVPAYTVAELGEMIPSVIVQKDRRIFPEVDCFLSEIDTKYYSGLKTNSYYEPRIKTSWSSSDTEADARASMLIYLLENKLITL